MVENHLKVSDLSYGKPVKEWLVARYGEKQAEEIWRKVQEQYNEYLPDLPDYGGKKNGHAMAIYGGLLIFALYPSLPDKPLITELQDFVQNLFMGPFVKLGKVFDLSRSFDMRLIDKVFRRSGNSDKCDYCVVACNNPLADEYEIKTDEFGFLVSRKMKK